jgi:hypothetical protein
MALMAARSEDAKIEEAAERFISYGADDSI